MSNFVNLLDIIYPVGSIYQSMSTTSPADFIGGTWTKIKTFLYGADAAKETGGEATHTLTVDEMPNHSHYFDGNWPLVASGPAVQGMNAWWGEGNVSTGMRNAGQTGGGASTQQLAAIHNLFHLVQNSIATLKANSLNLSEVTYV